MSKFKVGDKVYYPDMGTKVFQLEECNSLGNYPVCIYFGDGDSDFESFTSEGLAHRRNKLPQILHATKENQAKLEVFHGIKFEKPPVVPTSREIVKAMLARGDKYVCCWVSDGVETPTAENEWAYISDYMDDSFPFTVSSGSGWKYATPFNPRTGEPITELPT